jgi:enterobactin synthetase component D
LHLPDDLTHAVPKRRSEFLAGRLMAALALRQAGLPEIVGRTGRAPVWPEGVAGSITHSKDRAIAAVSTRYRGVGLDCEALVSTDRAMQLAATIFSETEARLRPDPLPFGTFFTLVFSAKEALYKALSPWLTQIPAFHDAVLTALQPGEMRIEMHGQSHLIRFRLSPKDCVTLVTQQRD